jgi:hypothetical protein
MILNTKYHDIREIINRKLEEFFFSLDHLENYFDMTDIHDIDLNNNDIERHDANKIGQNGDSINKNVLDQKEKNDNSKIYLSTSQIMSKILLGKIKDKINF